MRPGETIYKGHHSYDLMRNLQLGIIFSIAKSVEQFTGGGLKAPVKDEDFAQQVCCTPSLLFLHCESRLSERVATMGFVMAVCDLPTGSAGNPFCYSCLH